MPRGGWRPGAGRPRKTGLRTEGEAGVAEDVALAADRSRMTPLEYMLAVVRNPRADPSRRDKMAIAAAPFCHPRTAEIGKKVRQAEAARKAGGMDTEWAGDLDPNGHRPR